MKTNSSFGKIVDGEITYAPAQIVLADRVIPCPTAAVYAEHGYLPVNPAPAASEREGYELVRVGWEERGGAIFAVYEERALPPAVRVFTPLALIRVFDLLGKWEDLYAILQAAGAKTLYQFLTATELKEDDPVFSTFIGAAKAQYGDALVDRIIEVAAQGTEHVNTLTAADLMGGVE